MKTKSKVKGLFAALGIALSAVALTFTGIFFSKGKVDNSLTASADTATDYGAFLGSSNIQPVLGSGQSSKVYFGKDYADSTNGQPAILWRVLTNHYQDDAGQGDGLLLFSEKIIDDPGTNVDNKYNTAGGYNVNQATWYSSELRSYLNGFEHYYNNSTNSTASFIKDSSGNFTKYLTENEYNALTPTNLLTYGYSENIRGVMTTTSTVTGNTLNYGNPAGATSSSNAFNDGYVEFGVSAPNGQYYFKKETTKDTIFLLDYCDFFNNSYGFASHPNDTTATEWQDHKGYPLVAPNGLGGVANKSPVIGSSSTFMIRNSGRYNKDYNYSVVLLIHTNFGSEYQYQKLYSRPAVNLDPTKITYATTNTTLGSTLTKVGTPPAGTPEYKLFINQPTLDTSFKPTLKVQNNQLTVTYDNTVSDAQIVLLASPKNSTVGGVSYQAAIAATTGGTNQTATFDVSAISGGHYNITILKTSSNGGKYSETVYGVSDAKTYIPAPT